MTVSAVSGGRVLSLGNVVIDITARVDAFPAPGGDVFAADSALAPGGGFNAMAAAARQGVRVAYGGAHGTGPFGDLARSAMRAEGIEILTDPVPDADTGWDVAVTDAGGERTFITSAGAEGQLTAQRLAPVRVWADDVVLVSGYGLLHEINGPAVLELIETAPAGTVVVSDPGPLVADIPAEWLRRLLARTTWWVCNEREAGAMTGAADAGEAAVRIRELGAAGVIVRLGAAGCLVLGWPGAGAGADHVPGFRVPVVDTNGAGDAHDGVFAAALLRGIDPVTAARRANAAAALSVTRNGPATAPTAAETDEVLTAAGFMA